MLKRNKSVKEDKKIGDKQVNKNGTKWYSPIISRLTIMFSNPNKVDDNPKKAKNLKLSRHRVKESDELINKAFNNITNSKSGISNPTTDTTTDTTLAENTIETNSNTVSSGVKEVSGSNKPKNSLGGRPKLTKEPKPLVTQSQPQSSEPSAQQADKKERSSSLGNREFTYLKPVKHSTEKRVIAQPLVELKSERVLTTRPKLESVRDINSIGLMDKISLVTYFNDKKSGRLDERKALLVHKKNTEYMEKYYSLVSFLQEACIRSLELLGEYECYLQVDSKDRDVLDEVIQDPNLSSYIIEIFYENTILSKLKVEPVMLRIRMREF